MIAEQYGTDMFGKRISAIYKAAVWKGVYSYEGVTICEKSANRI